MFLPGQNERTQKPACPTASARGSLNAQPGDTLHGVAFAGLDMAQGKDRTVKAIYNSRGKRVDLYGVPESITTDNGRDFTPLSEISNFKSEIPLVRTGQGRPQRDNAAVLDLWDLFMMLLGASLILIALFLAHAL